jgi:endonuclease/exonuclease/phosphatase family metal-dependent hydrolase
VIGLQEVESRHGRTEIDQGEALGEALGMACIEGPLVHGAPGWYGNALLTRRPVRAVRRVLFEDRGGEARGAIIADLAGVDGVGWRVLTTHLDLHVGRRRRQFETLLDELLPATTVPAVVLGDFNEWWPFSRGLKALRRHAVLPFAPATFPTRCPLLALDRIALSGCRLRGRVRRHITPLSRMASDHLPIWAEVVASPAIGSAPSAARDEDAACKESPRRRHRSQGGRGGD